MSDPEELHIVARSKWQEPNTFGGNTFRYALVRPLRRSDATATVNVGWGLMSPQVTTVFINKELVALWVGEVNDPDEALRRLGIVLRIEE